MVWVCPPHTSISLYWRPGSHSAAIFAASARALSASRNSSTNRIMPTLLLLLDQGCLQRRDLVLVGLPDALEELHGRGRLLLVDLRQGEADVDQHPFARYRRVVGKQPDVDHPPHSAHVHLGQVGLFRVKLDDLTGYAEAHVRPPPRSAARAPDKSWSALPGSGAPRTT